MLVDDLLFQVDGAIERVRDLEYELDTARGRISDLEYEVAEFKRTLNAILGRFKEKK